jgi:hypothetical protein
MCALALTLLKHAPGLGTQTRPDKDKATTRRQGWWEQGQGEMGWTRKEVIEGDQRDLGRFLVG